jgi:tetratricopeptide (TPR) repeat protein
MEFRSSALLLIMTTLMLAGLSLSAFAQTQEQIDWCQGKNNATPDLQIGGCTAVIQSGRFDGKGLATAFKNRCWAHLALSYKTDRGTDEALSDCDQAIRLNPDNIEAISLRGSVYFKRKDYDLATKDFSLAIKLDPKNAGAFNQRGILYLELKKYDLAARDFSESAKVNPNTNTNNENSLTVAKSLANRCLALTLAGQFQTALADCNEAQRLVPDWDNPLRGRGLIYLKMGNLEQALAEYEAALKLDGKSPYSLYGRGVVKLRRGDVTGGNMDIAAAKAIKADIAEVSARTYGL